MNLSPISPTRSEDLGGEDSAVAAELSDEAESPVGEVTVSVKITLTPEPDT